MKGFGHFSPEVPEMTAGGWSYGGSMTRARQKPANTGSGRVWTKAGEVITPELINALAAEAEKGYDLSQAQRRRITEPASRSKKPADADS
jgi:hypothetical protein